MAKKRELTEKQQAFLEALFNDAEYDFKKAKEIAGYADSVPAWTIVKTLRQEIIERAEMVLAFNAPKAAFSLTSVMDDPVQLGAKEKMSAAKEVLDRVGVVKTERVSVEGEAAGIFILPAKKAAITEDE